MDVKTAFVNGMVEQEVYIEQPQGFTVHESQSHVCKLKKALYGLKQAPRAWYARIDGFLKSLGFVKNIADSNLYFKVLNGFPVILILYIDDLFLTGNEKLIAGCKEELSKEFEMKDIGLMHYFLGLEVWQRDGEIFLNQGKYTVEILKRFRMMDCKSMATPMNSNLKLLYDDTSESFDPTVYRQVIRSLMYLVNTRPDNCFAVNALSQYMVEPRHVRWIPAKHVLRYLNGTIRYGLRYVSDRKMELLGYTDYDGARSAADRKSTSGCCFGLGSGMISWYCRKQTSVALNTAEAEYIAACGASKEAVWLRKMLTGLFDQELDVTVIHCDNQSCIKLSENPVDHDRSPVKSHRHQIPNIRDMLRKGAVKLQYISTEEHTTNIITKRLSKVKFEYFRDKLGVVENVSPH